MNKEKLQIIKDEIAELNIKVRRLVEDIENRYVFENESGEHKCVVLISKNISDTNDGKYFFGAVNIDILNNE